MCLTAEINSDLRNIWKEERKSGKRHQYDEFLRKWPMQYPELRENCIVFVGLNPSFREHHDEVCKLNDTDELDSLEKRKSVILAQAESEGQISQDSYSYYDAFDCFVNRVSNTLSLKFKWEALEVFAVRERRQETVKKLLRSESGWTDFAKQQWKVFHKALNEIKPVCVVVANAFASDLISNHVDVADGLEPKFDIVDSELLRVRGYRIVKLSGTDVPLLLSGMINGQRLLDKYSLERLIWMTCKSISEMH